MNEYIDQIYKTFLKRYVFSKKTRKLISLRNRAFIFKGEIEAYKSFLKRTRKFLKTFMSLRFKFYFFIKKAHENEFATEDELKLFSSMITKQLTDIKYMLEDKSEFKQMRKFSKYFNVYHLLHYYKRRFKRKSARIKTTLYKRFMFYSKKQLDLMYRMYLTNWQDGRIKFKYYNYLFLKRRHKIMLAFLKKTKLFWRFKHYYHCPSDKLKFFLGILNSVGYLKFNK